MEQTIPHWETLAAVDLGSNSFHMIIARANEGQVQVVDRLRDQVQLRAGLAKNGYLSDEAQARGVACLMRFGERVREIPRGKVRAVGTKTLRSAKNGAEFLEAAQQALGHPIEIISGQEEARLIYLGVAHSESDEGGRRLVVDIGGASTEFIIGERFEPLDRESLAMGCVSASLSFFPKNVIAEKAMRRAEIAAHLELEAIQKKYRHMGWTDSIGASGTIRAVGAVLEANGWREHGITLKGLYKIRKALIKAGSADALSLDGLSEDRKSVFPGGVAILIAAFEALAIGHMRVSEGALREGLLYEHLGRIHHEDVREQTIRVMAKRYHVDSAFAERVDNTAQICLNQVARLWDLEGEENSKMLRWAVLTHEIGLSIAHSRYHHHGAYLIRYSDMPGFSRQNQDVLSALVRAHRRKFSRKVLNALPAASATTIQRLAILLRLAVLLNHSRGEEHLPAVNLLPGKKSLELIFPNGWLSEHPLIDANLEQEAEYLKATHFKLRFH